MATDAEKLRHAKEQANFWKKEVDRLTALVAGAADGVFPRLAHVHVGIYGDSFGVVLGRIDHEFDHTSWPCLIVNRKTRRVTKMKSGWPLLGFDGDQLKEPHWMTEQEERKVIEDFPRSAWAKEIAARLA